MKLIVKYSIYKCLHYLIIHVVYTLEVTSSLFYNFH